VPKNTVNVEKILKEIESFFGFVPKIFRVLSESPEALKTYYDKFEMIMKDNSLPSMTKELISIGAAAALGSEHCLRTHLEVARSFGATNKQVFQAVIIGASISETTALSNSLRVYEDFKK
jgi:AhpD family alkylhydroperoxidase